MERLSLGVLRPLLLKKTGLAVYENGPVSVLVGVFLTRKLLPRLLFLDRRGCLGVVPPLRVYEK